LDMHHGELTVRSFANVHLGAGGCGKVYGAKTLLKNPANPAFPAVPVDQYRGIELFGELEESIEDRPSLGSTVGIDLGAQIGLQGINDNENRIQPAHLTLDDGYILKHYPAKLFVFGIPELYPLDLIHLGEVSTERLKPRHRDLRGGVLDSEVNDVPALLGN